MANMERSSTKQLPSEILQMIISFNSPELLETQEGYTAVLYTHEEARAKDDMLACSRVSSCFRELACRSLFQTVAVGLNPKRVSSYHGRSRCRCRQLSDLDAMATNLPVVRDNVRELRIHMGCYVCCPGVEDPLELDGLLLLRVLRKLSKLRILHLQNASLSWGARVPACVEVEPILSLDLFNFAFPSYGSSTVDVWTLQPILASLTQAKKLCFSGGTFERRQEPFHTLGDRKFVRPIQVSFFVTKYCTRLGELLSFLENTSAIEPASIQTLKLGYLNSTSDCLPRASAFTRSFASTMTQLTLTIKHKHLSSRSWCLNRIGIGQYMRLEHFTLQLIHTPSLKNNTILTILRSLRGLPSLRSITLDLDSQFGSWNAFAESKFGALPVTAIEDAILKLSSIESLAIELPRMRRLKDYDLHMAQWTRTVLPRLHERGLLA